MNIQYYNIIPEYIQNQYFFAILQISICNDKMFDKKEVHFIVKLNIEIYTGAPKMLIWIIRNA